MIVDISHEKVDRPFTYRIPEEIAQRLRPGMRVQIPFGAGNTLRTGYVTELVRETSYPADRLKQIAAILPGEEEPEQKMIALAAWMKEHYGSTMIQALKTVLPARRKVEKKKKKEVCLALDSKEAAAALQECERKHQAAKARLMRELIKEPVLPWELVTKKLCVPASTLKSLETAGAIRVTKADCYRNPVKLPPAAAARKKLSDAQEQIVKQMMQGWEEGDLRPSLIHGITGSGKTEVYLSLIEGMIKKGKQAIFLIPEIALTYQTLLRIYQKFGDRVSVMNSSLSPGEKQDQCLRARNGQIDVIIGPRSALFVPFPRLGLIVIDEEHETSYKSEIMPKYHARETAVELARLNGAAVVMGSATPSLEAYSRAKSGEYRLFTLKERMNGGCLPRIYVEDLRRELREGNRTIFSRRLQDALRERLEKGEQSMLFLNRRGYAGFVSCRACGYVCKCPHCDVSLSEHRGGRLVCHYCGYVQPALRRCPSCGSPYILGFKAGTEQIEEQLGRFYPNARVLRMDGDTTRTKDSYERILSAFSNREADILVGTQMIVKGHDFPNVTLVGVLAADLSLSVSDYRAGERTFQLLTQAAGRAGRGSRPGEVVIQTYQPDHYSIRYAAGQDYEGFYREEMVYRRLMSYPPAAHILAIQLACEQEETAMEGAREAALLARRLAQRWEDEKDGTQKTVVIGPAPAFISKINDIYRYGVYVKSRDYGKLTAVKNAVETLRSRQEKPKGSCQFDFDPVHTY